MLIPPPLSLYVHIPWCVRKCPYCDFNSHKATPELPEAAYIERLLEDLELDLPLVWGRTVQSIFIGGGTPSLFSADAIDALLSGIRSRITCHPGLEVTLECNPGTGEYAPFQGYAQAGVNRISLGVQSFSNSHLKTLGRIHDAQQAQQAFSRVRDAGLENINIDLMYGLPQQSPEQAIADIETALTLQPAHISWYQLTIEPNTLFAVKSPVLPDDDATWDMLQHGAGLLESAGFAQYEVSAWARDDQACKHNLNYWSFGDYLGIGAGAHGKITSHSGVQRSLRQRQPKAYLAEPVEKRRIRLQSVPQTELAFEYFLNRLRLKKPFSLQQFEQCTGIDSDPVLAQLQKLQDQELVSAISPGQWSLTDKGWLFLDTVQGAFLPD